MFSSCAWILRCVERSNSCKKTDVDDLERISEYGCHTSASRRLRLIPFTKTSLCAFTILTFSCLLSAYCAQLLLQVTILSIMLPIILQECFTYDFLATFQSMFNCFDAHMATGSHLSWTYVLMNNCSIGPSDIPVYHNTGLTIVNVCISHNNAQHTSSGIIRNGLQTFTKMYIPLIHPGS
jgi:hypothetical protein